MPRIQGDRRDRGAASVEYALIAVAISGVIVAILFVLGGTVHSLFDASCDEIVSASEPAETC